MKSPKFTIFRSKQNYQFYYRLEASNGEIILYGESYVSKQACESGIASVKANAANESSYERKDGTSNFTFNLKAANGAIVGRSENYKSKQNRESGIESVKKNAPIAGIDDQT